MKTIAELEEKLSRPSRELVKDIGKIEGDILLLGVAGKMGPSLARLLVRAIQEAGIQKEVIGVSRFSDQRMKNELENEGVRCVQADLLDDAALQDLPFAENLIYLAGKKFGTSADASTTWAMNAYLPGRVSEKFRKSRMVVFSSGNVYPFVPCASGGATEDTPPDPLGDYAQSCLGRERIFQYFSHRYQIPMLIYRLNYAIDMRYGNLLEIGKMVQEGKAIDLRTGHMNVIWQGDANEVAIRSLLHTSCPPKLLNVTGPETVSIQQVAEKFGELMNTRPQFVNEPEQFALLSNASRSHRMFGYPRVSLLEMIELTAEWILSGGPTLDKPTHFQEREGKF
ncbi:NAD-dependent epimerase/dehydratase family protein [Cyclobacterium xiamenense]|jgi:nucleoside-diphosphate-sugar epimerase|uniref:NAD-dependent epimerase/dehydratase family protein n=1 Tax=Cyclobacterium xiamenense TaxID=1297121 RepID=UPI0012B8CA40|nr:NAD(P)-dependent oxidoreductase [Cyclobacterium xiamenense]